ncbi:phage tail protein [Salmonella enterica subsp. enterica]|uniref:tail protein X n=1 Tax=Salmonella enterica TaxID=28901 RepID=UPI00071ABE81|nr:tail protein X [Salmonella enterica]EAA8631522.1 phage tail protein [Salmonella enterica subsp. enterica]EBV5179193.1 phage tail protein [Salmonella enterica subsp. enterica serovar Carmel]EBX1063871.1 phage tail protein [Salmonella enterica subsp. enterica serovar Oranienburg]ECA2175752.1 phage tail protein [Salmonella enterica subsp. enterica serovar Kisangani]EGI5882388.1 phage tail protein [Salmonella enterica subsp. enterica serovar Magwa]EGX2063399.1 phage tail protein [Salmonella en
MPTTWITRDGDVLDAICATHYGTENLAAVLTLVLEANQGLAEKGAVYPAGISIVLPEITQQVSESPYSLWD